MNCPKCGYEQYCPCPSCQKSEYHFTPEGMKPWVWTDGEFISCAGCGFKAHVDWWETWEMQQYEGNHISPVAEKTLFGYTVYKPGQSWRVFDFCSEWRHVVTSGKVMPAETAFDVAYLASRRRTLIMNMQTGNQDYYV